MAPRHRRSVAPVNSECARLSRQFRRLSGIIPPCAVFVRNGGWFLAIPNGRRADIVRLGHDRESARFEVPFLAWQFRTIRRDRPGALLPRDADLVSP